MPPAPPHWDEESAQLHQNLAELLRKVRVEARRRRAWSSRSIVKWHAMAMRGLELPPALPKKVIGSFRGARGLEGLGARVASRHGVPAEMVEAALCGFDLTLRQSLSQLDSMIPRGEFPSRELLLAVIDVCAWAHAEWVRIHPFANGNGRTARLLSNGIAMRYGLRPFLRLRPRPNAGYSGACACAMRGDWRPTAEVFAELVFKRSSRRPDR